MKFTELKKALIDKYDWVKNHTWFKDKVLLKQIIEIVENSINEYWQGHYDFLKIEVSELKSTIDKKDNEIGSLKYSLTESNKTKELLRNDLSNFKNTLSKKDLTISGLMANKTAYQKEIEILKHSLQSCELQLKYDENTITGWIKYGELSSKQIADLKQTIKELQLINNQLQSRLTFLEKNNHEGYSTAPFLPLDIESRVKKLEGKVFIEDRNQKRIDQLIEMGYSLINGIYSNSNRPVTAIMPFEFITDSSDAFWNEIIKFHKGERCPIFEEEKQKLQSI